MTRAPAPRLQQCQHLPGGTYALFSRIPPRRNTRQLGVRKGEVSQWLPQHRARRRITILAIKETGPDVGIGVPPAVENDPGNVAPGIETRVTEELHHLLSDLCLKLPIARCKELRPRDLALSFKGQSALRERNIECEQRRQIRIVRRPVVSNVHRCANIAGEAKSPAPCTGRVPESVEETPVI